MPDVKPVTSARVFVSGTEIEMNHLLDLKVRDNLLLPDTASVRIQDPDGAFLDNPAFTVGAPMEVRFGALDDPGEEPLFKGDIEALEPEFGEQGRVVAARAYDRGHKLHRNRRSKTFQNQKAEDMVREVGQAVGLQPGTIDSTPAVHDFFQQSMETDWEFCWRLAKMNDFEFLVQDTKFHFRKRQRQGAAATLKYGENLLAFKPRMTAAGQVKEVTVANHDPQAAQPLNARATTPELKGASQAVQQRDALVGQLGGTVVVADRVVTSAAEAEKLAQATLDRLASRFVEAEGKALGEPKLRAGVTVKIEETGSFSGEYVLSQTTHHFGSQGARYTTAFTISGSSGHTFTELLGGGNGNGNGDWSSSLVIGIVTNNNDPIDMGRVRVKFPALGDTMEGWWARVATLNAGPERGMFMLPQVGDEVVVAFEHGDTRRPLVLGSLYNGKNKVPDDLKDAQGRQARFGVKSDESVHVEAEKDMTLRSKEKMLVEVTGGPGDFTLDAKGKVKQTSGGTFEVQSNQSVTVKGSSSVTVESTGSLTLKGASIDIQASGPVNVKGAMINLG
jgi:phage protein D/phage baseplate assembly protein gpV